ncbi:hypothetical protein, partial [Paraprevotella clara]|uniref:hypothetical protein n=1 Tax=Paraprevotella clara TaxID=454154 RepID=UPI0040252AF9
YKSTIYDIKINLLRTENRLPQNEKSISAERFSVLRQTKRSFQQGKNVTFSEESEVPSHPFKRQGKPLLPR